MKKIIGIDFDDVLMDFNHGLMSFYNSRNGTTHVREDVKHYRIERLWGCEPEEVTNVIVDFYDSPAHLETLPLKGALEAIELLSREHELVIVTARPEIVREQTEKWIAKHFPEAFQRIFYVNKDFSDLTKKANKSDICKELGVELFIDDSFHNARDIANSGIKVLLFDAPWNRGVEHQNVERVFTWEEIIERLKVI